MNEQLKKKINIESLLHALKSLNYKVFENDKRDYNLNIVGIRSSDMTPDVFNDIFTVFWKFQGNWNLFKFAFTCDPGLYYLNNPMNVDGTAIMAEQQAINAYTLDYHKNYIALVQIAKMYFYRDRNKDNKYDLISENLIFDIIGANIHRAHRIYEMQNVGKYSAGCQVFQNPGDYYTFINKIIVPAAAIWGKKFSYTLINEKNL